MAPKYRARIGAIVLSALVGIALVAPARGLAQSPATCACGGIDLNAMIRVAARLYGLDPNLLAAIARVESDGNSDAISPKGAEGLMQLMPATAAQYGVRNPFDPVQSLLGAARFLSHLKRMSRSRAGSEMNLPDLIAAYNAGASAVAKYHGIPPYTETRRYVRRVLLTYFAGAAPFASAVAPGTPKPARPLVNGRNSVMQTHAHEDALARIARIQRMRSRALARQQREYPRWPR